MRTQDVAWVGVVATVAATACGGRTEAIEGRGSGDDAGDHAEGGPSDASPAPIPTPTPTPTSTSQPGPGPTPVGDDEVDAEVEVDAGVTCTSEGASGSSSGGGCQIGGQELCSDNTTYRVSCECPAGTCTCEETFQNGNMGGGSSGGASFSSCPVCPTEQQMWSLCGFPGQ
jgi:hypothetical protein